MGAEQSDLMLEQIFENLFCQWSSLMNQSSPSFMNTKIKVLSFQPPPQPKLTIRTLRWVCKRYFLRIVPKPSTKNLSLNQKRIQPYIFTIIKKELNNRPGFSVELNLYWASNQQSRFDGTYIRQILTIDSVLKYSFISCTSSTKYRILIPKQHI